MTTPEIRISGYIHSEPLPPGAVLATHGGLKRADELCIASTVVASIEAARAAGARALAVTIDSVGGGELASGTIYRALRRFSELGGTVIVHVTGMAASSASTIALAGDLVFLAPDARFIVHSALIVGACPDGDRVIAEANAAALAIYLGRTWTPLAVLQEALGKRYDPAADRYHCAELRAEAAVEFGWADGTATVEDVLALAAHVQAGAHVSTPRRMRLQDRGGQAEASIVADKIATNAVTAAKIEAGSITTDKISAVGLDASVIKAGTIDAARINAIDLAAASATIGGRNFATIGHVLGLIVARCNNRGVLVAKSASVLREVFNSIPSLKVIVNNGASPVTASLALCLEGSLYTANVGAPPTPTTAPLEPIVHATVTTLEGGLYLTNYYVGLYWRPSGGWIDPDAVGTAPVLHATTMAPFN